MYKLFIFTISIFVALNAQAQRSEAPYNLRIGKPFPEFRLRDVLYYSKKDISLIDFRGHWVVLDFWNRYCTNCITEMPHLSQLADTFLNKVQFLLIGYTGSNYFKTSDDKVIRNLFEKVRKKYALHLPIAFDSILYNHLKVSGLPFIVVIDPVGIVRGVTYGIQQTDINNLIDGKLLHLPDVRLEAKYNQNLPLLTYGNGGPDSGFLFRSLLSEWNPSLPDLTPAGIEKLHNNRFEVMRKSVDLLYKYAYLGKLYITCDDSLYGKVYPFLVLNVRDSSLFQPNWETGKNLFCYSITVPTKKIDRCFIMTAMQRDLQNYFGYKIEIESRMMPYWSLVSMDNTASKLRTKGGESQIKNLSHGGFTCTNCSISNLITVLSGYFQNDSPFLDDTGIKSNIDISIDALLPDFDDFNAALQRYDLRLIKNKKEMKVIVVKDQD